MKTADFTTENISERTQELFTEQQQSIAKHTDQLFGWLMTFQWLAAVLAAIWISPRTWTGTSSSIHIHVWAAILLGGAITSLPVVLVRLRPGSILTRHSVAIGQMLMSGLLIHLTGGRIETHFHVFGSLAILAFYRDWRVLISASLVVYADHLLRGFFWPQSVYGVLSAPVWRSFEHAGWVAFEVIFLIISIQKSLEEMRAVAERQANLEQMNETIELKVAERTAELSHSQAQLAQAQHIAKIGSWEWDMVGDKLSLSEETRRLYGIPATEAEPSMAQTLAYVHPEDRVRVQQILAEAARSRQSFVCDHRAKLADGTDRHMLGRGQVVVNERGEPVKMFGITQDVTESRRAEDALRLSEERLRQSQKMEAVGRLAGGVAHDFNNLLTVITGYCGICLQDLDDSHEMRKHLEEIQQSAERAASLTHQLLAFSRKQVLQPRVLKINDVVQGMEKMLRRLIGEDVDLVATFDAGLGQVRADPGQIEQVILNLAVNARDAMPRGGKLTIETSNVTLDQKTKSRNRTIEPGEYVMFAVSDTGVGMTEEVQSHLFEPFFTTKGVGKGTGLGLATCYGIVAQSGGDIQVYSEPGFGTVFKVYLPRIDTVEVAETCGKPEALPTGSENILIVEDDPAVRRLAVFVLRKQGYNVREATNAPDALGLIRKGTPFDLVITDVIMPQMSGKQLYDEIKELRPRARVLFMSGYTDDALAHHGVLDASLSFLEKPFSPPRLSRKVREVIDAVHLGA